MWNVARKAGGWFAKRLCIRPSGKDIEEVMMCELAIKSDCYTASLNVVRSLGTDKKAVGFDVEYMHLDELPGSNKALPLDTQHSLIGAHAIRPIKITSRKGDLDGAQNI
ncbi:hypothetical protein CCAX7_36530 [Capsulimonas corticalis]|uniref:Uncharacterized protein n=1 Tax=Capsulimonas corticalis TaxID=2219043 RepID=A0A402D1I5_9BACT|nr:hypothetical protein CCAX7_36530 [Capsulimonas corticalis]